MIRGKCRTFIDKEFKWPEIFAAVPRIGEEVQAEPTTTDSLGFRMRVRGVIHTVQWHTVANKDVRGGQEQTLEPFIIVELE